MAKKTIDDVQLSGKKVLIRCDFNVPLDGSQNISDDRRIQESLPTIRKVVDSGAAVILCSHLGRPEGAVDPKMSLKPVAARLKELLGKPVQMAGDCIGAEVEALKSKLKGGEILLLENLRFHKAETKNKDDFSKELAKGIDIFVNDAFGTAHRAHASTEGVTRFVPISVSGYLVEKELKYLGDAVNAPKRPFIAVLGGAKISGKIDVIKSLFDKVDVLIIGGGMIFTFYKAQGLNIGSSLLEADRVEMAGQLLAEAKSRNIKLLLADDVVIADKFDNNANRKVVSIKDIPDGWMGLDIGPKTIKKYCSEILKSKTVVWNGPMGAFEMSNFEEGTRKIAEALAEATRKSGSVTVVGGGDSAAAMSQFNLEDQVTHISTGGGASLEFLEGKVLPGIDALADK
ncbi:MAG: phosphoglycerate kinase [SAR324 cluster bacterium]|nr:phosphoglycerate kinase [SAR324 cluster bacterium]